METTLVRGFVLLLALTGFGASSFSTNPSAPTSGRAKVHANDDGSFSTGLPTCPPSDPNHCGMQ